MTLTARTVDALKPRASRYEEHDDKLPGFYVVVRPNGSASFMFRYRNQYGQQRKLLVGRVGEIKTPAARKIAEGYAAAVRQGQDPAALRQANRAALTVQQLADLYLESGRFAEKAASTQKNDRSRLTRHILPLLARDVVKELTAERVRWMQKQIRDGKTAVNEKTGFRGRARVTGSARVADLCVTLLSAMLKWAMAEGLSTENPCVHVHTAATKRREAVVEGPDAYREFFAALDRMEERRQLTPSQAAALRVLAWTGARSGEVTRALWRHYDQKAHRIVLDTDEHKTGRRTSRKRTIALPSPAVEAIDRLPRAGREDLIFKPYRGSNPMDLNSIWKRVRAEAGLPDDLTIHGLRHSLASALAADGASMAEIMAQLGHQSPVMAARYIHAAEESRRIIANRAANALLTTRKTPDDGT